MTLQEDMTREGHTVPAKTPGKPDVSGKKGRGRRVTLLVALGVALPVLILVAAGSGQVDIPPGQVLGSVLHRLGIPIGDLPTAAQGENALWIVRIPRVLMAAVTGAALGCAGALMQGVFGNPLAEPGVIGVSSGAAVGAAAVITFGLTGLGNWTVVAAAFVCGLLTTLAVYAMARANGRTEVVTLLLTGIAVNAVAGAALGLLMFLSSNDALRSITSWQLGSLAGSTWDAVYVVGPIAVVGCLVAIALGRRLDLLALGERTARHLGVNVERLRFTGIVVIALLTSAAVAFSGIISFVGLVIPHLVRMAVGPGHRVLLPASALGGACLLVVADLVARTAVPYQELPLGVLTAVVGGPFFFWLLRRTRARSGGWG
ncbi:iron ABC transporter permease [Actinocorallia sp. A-T 12471]|uniref:FecCD family ABC transporter permease n=1 Tax=Actinocorallia sp. A-T 12471 TaxID=3089813 RepID=UPI0029CBA379|nr:iron ABC transporter permease [Actinocorallia sp. A-T 12471]MDX6740276.1 iron ABC transporter permease [Actinocorallia sp. A-T 12471]